MTDSATSSGDSRQLRDELNELHAEKGRFYARYFAARPGRLASDPPATDEAVGELLDENAALRARVAELEPREKQLAEDLSRKNALLATASVQVAIKLSRSHILRLPVLRHIGQALARITNRLMR